MIYFNLRKRMVGLCLIITSLFSLTACAVDNPDAVDVVNQFEQQEKSYLAKIENPNNTNRAYLIAYDDYQIFLDKELNIIYKKLMSHLTEVQKNELKASQKYWLLYRDAEFELIKNNWTRDSFGSSSGMMRGQYRASIIRDRIIQLMHYLKSY